jgi:glutamine synthetase
MQEDSYILNPNKLVQFLRKPSSQFTKADIIRFVEAFEIKMINFRYVAEDGKLKTLNFIINSRDHLDNILSNGERVDGSSLFSYIGAGSSDLYVLPRYRTAFINPFAAVPTLEFLCSFYTNEGLPLESAPEYILKKAKEDFKKSTGFDFLAFGELEYYVIYPKSEMYQGIDQKGYHESFPFTRWEPLRVEAMQLIAEAGGNIKYGHSEVGYFSTENFTHEQHEIEFLPVDVEQAAEQLIIAKWILRMLGNKYNVNISFGPKITVGKAGSGLHIHMMLQKDGKNIMVEKGTLSDVAKRMIAGILDISEALTAFGNTVPTSYFRLVPHQEAPTNICWGDRNRSVLVRVPLGWVGAANMIKHLNPQETSENKFADSKQTVEFRAGDGSADIYNLLAGLIVGAKHGLEMPNALDLAKRLYVDVNIFREENKEVLTRLNQLPVSCGQSADCLQAKREVFEKSGIFPAGTIDRFIRHLKSYHDEDLSERLYNKNDEIRKLVDQFLHCM